MSTEESEQPEHLWTTLERETIHTGRVTLVDHAVVLPDGTHTRYEVDESVPFAVATLVIDGTDVLLSRQYRYPINQWIYDLPGGVGDAGEEPAVAAARELEEELGLVAKSLHHLHTYFMNPGRASYSVHIFASTGPVSTGTPLTDDPSEQVRLVRMSVTRLDSLIKAGRIGDPTVIIARALAGVHRLLPPLGSA